MLSASGARTICVRWFGAFAAISIGRSAPPVLKPPYVPRATKLVRLASFCAPPSAWMYLAEDLVGRHAANADEPLRIRIVDRRRVLQRETRDVFGLGFPRWQVKQVTRGRPPKFASFRPFIIAIIWRAFVISGVVIANAARS